MASKQLPHTLEDAVGEFTGSAVRVQVEAAIPAFHQWSGGGFGELVSRRTADGAVLCELLLSTVEAYFLAFETRRLTIRHAQPEPTSLRGSSEAACSHERAPLANSSNLLTFSPNECWIAFREASSRFPHRYAVYRALRTAGWVVRTGVKYGADFTLYEPALVQTSHALFCALVASTSESAEQSWCWLQQHVRLCHGVSKGLPRHNNPSFAIHNAS